MNVQLTSSPDFHMFMKFVWYLPGSIHSISSLCGLSLIQTTALQVINIIYKHEETKVES